jgi:hypothetical protein
MSLGTETLSWPLWFLSYQVTLFFALVWFSFTRLEHGVGPDTNDLVFVKRRCDRSSRDPRESAVALCFDTTRGQLCSRETQG